MKRGILLLLILQGLRSFAQSPANDQFTNAIPLNGNSVTFSGTLSNATYEWDEFTCYDYSFCMGGPHGSVWWSWTATNSTTVVVDQLAGLTTSGGFAIYEITNAADSGFGLGFAYLDRITNRYLIFSASAGKTYQIRAWGGSAEFFTLRLTAAALPVILATPQSQELPSNSSAFFSVIAAGHQPLKYQWQLDGNSLPGETAHSLMIHALNNFHAGGYSVIVSNLAGVTTSAVANLTVSASNALPTLTALNIPNTNRFFFTVNGQSGHRYQIARSSNPSFPNIPADYLLIENSIDIALHSDLKSSSQRFYRASPHPEICIAHLKAIHRAIRLWAIENNRDNTYPVGESDIIPYLKSTEVFCCPSGGTWFGDSYAITTVALTPVCQRVYDLHELPW